MTEFLTSVSPADPRDEVGRFPVWDARALDEAVSRAREAFPTWRATPFEERASLLRRFRDAVRADAEPLARLISREMGKALWEARAEVASVAAKIDLTLEEGMHFVAPLEARPGTRAGFHPRGVLAVLGPFNFPAHLPNGHIAPALATGNTVVFKPSELTPAVGDRLARLYRNAGLPPGVLEIVHGRAETGALLAAHPGVDGVLFTGSWAAGRAIQEATLDQPHKILALEMGGKNGILVLRDADLDLAVAETAISICATTGQRCTCASRVFVEEPLVDSFTERLRAVLRGVRVGPPLDPGVFMGPLVSPAAHQKLARFRALAAEAGGERLLPAEVDHLPPYTAPGLTRFADAGQKHPYLREEIFGPEAAVLPVVDLEHGIAALNDSDYGLAASVFSRNRRAFEQAVGRVAVGVLNWNRGTVGASGRLPFGGLRKSGNDRPAGILSAVYCTFPQAHLEHPGGFDPASLPPGMPPP